MIEIGRLGTVDEGEAVAAVAAHVEGQLREAEGVCLEEG
jgi:hypothetical protein